MTKVKTIYGTAWCRDCKRSKTYLAEQRIPYKWVDIEEDEESAKMVDIEEDEESAKIVEKVNDGKRRVPTIEFDDGTFLSVPSNAELAKKLGLVTTPKHKVHDIMVIGGGPAGLTCALYTSREAYDTLLIEKGALGGQVGVTEKLEN
ncbi:MAG: glutaredoxin domain-containing protein [Candidatus Heimdallarchaeota archaeon]